MAHTIVLLAVLFCVVSLATARPTLSAQEYQNQFVSFVQTYQKSYETAEFLKNFNVFSANVDKINTHNANPDKTYTMAVNQFADLTADQWAARNHGLQSSHNKSLQQRYESAENQSLISQLLNQKSPMVASHVHDNNKYVSWKNYTGPVRNQQSCGSCVSFSLTSSISTFVHITQGNLYTYAPQQIVDCATLCLGCNGCLPPIAADLVRHWGVALEKDYPYTGVQGICREREVRPGPHTLGMKNVLVHGDAEIQAALKKGPVTALVAASSSSFQFYSTGILNDCTDILLNHSISIVGYGVDAVTGLEYYEILNSWGEKWGDAGFIRIVAGSGGWKSCGLGLSFDVSLMF